MSKARGFTKGPWEVDTWGLPHRFAIYDSEGMALVATEADSRRLAAFIKATPLMYEVLQKCIEVMGEAGSDEHLKQLTNTELGRLWVETRNEALAAIRATGL